MAKKRGKSASGTDSAATHRVLNRRALLTTLGAGLVASRLGKARALPADVTPAAESSGIPQCDYNPIPFALQKDGKATFDLKVRNGDKTIRLTVKPINKNKGVEGVDVTCSTVTEGSQGKTGAKKKA